MAEATYHSQACLLALPRKLRDIIYDFVFSKLNIKIQPRRVSTAKAGVILSCTQLYHKSNHCYYTRAPFPVIRLHTLVQWLIKLPVQYRKAIQSVKFEPSMRSPSLKAIEMVRKDFKEIWWTPQYRGAQLTEWHLSRAAAASRLCMVLHETTTATQAVSTQLLLVAIV